MKNLPAFVLCLHPGWAVVLASLAGLPAQGQSRYTVLANGQEVADAQTGLTWRRCTEGMVFSGSTCTGAYLRLTHEAALAHARDQAGWRLPNVKELQTLVDKSRINPSINISAFPATPPSPHWTSTPYVADSSLAFAASFDGGVINRNFRSNSYAVRLVRASQ